MNLQPEIWTAEVVYTGFGTPMLKGGLAVVGDSIAAVGLLEELQTRFHQAPVIHKGKALSPKLVNAHTHLDLSKLPYYQGPYTGFIRHVIAHTTERGVEAAQIGLAELRTLGVGSFGDIVARSAVMDFLLAESDLSGVAYYEVLGADPGKASGIFAEVKPKLLAWKKLEGSVRVGISPHTAHTVSAPLLKLLIDFAQLEGFPLQIHLAESPQELAYFKSNTGPLAEFMAPFNSSWATPGQSPVQYLADLGLLSSQLTLVHAVQVDEHDVQTLAQSGSKVVSCPRSNLGLECGALPWKLYSQYGLEVALGTDSRGSSPDLDVRNEALALWDRVDRRTLVRAATRSGYRVLGLDCPRLTRGTPVSSVQSW